MDTAPEPNPRVGQAGTFPAKLPPAETPPDVDTLLAAWRCGEGGAVDGLFALVYDDLRSLARRQLAWLRSGKTLAPTVVVHEVYARFAERSSKDVLNRHHFLALAARAMRDVIVDYVRRRQA